MCGYVGVNMAGKMVDHKDLSEFDRLWWSPALVRVPCLQCSVSIKNDPMKVLLIVQTHTITLL